jgi:hypothetical protein
VQAAMDRIAATGVDYVKAGLFPPQWEQGGRDYAAVFACLAGPRPQAAVRTRRLAAVGPHRVARTAEPRLPGLPWCAVQRAGEGAGAGRRRRKTRARYARRPQLRSGLRTLLFAHAWTKDSRCGARASEEAATMMRARPAESTGARCARANMNMRGNLRVRPLLFPDTVSDLIGLREPHVVQVVM